jgi:hypothetical protein
MDLSTFNIEALFWLYASGLCLGPKLLELYGQYNQTEDVGQETEGHNQQLGKTSSPTFH